jgi:RNA polymerase sigma factor (sigma-70 family)
MQVPTTCSSQGNGLVRSSGVSTNRAISDAEALWRLRSDPDAIVVLYDRYVGRLVADLARRSGNAEVAFDLVQETFARVLEHGHRVRLEPEGSAWPWISAVARNLLSDFHRRGIFDSTARTRLGITTPAYDADAIDALIARLDAAALEGPLDRALAALPSDQRHAVTGRITRDLSYPELAADLGTSEQVVRARVSRGLRAMRLRLSGGKP